MRSVERNWKSHLKLPRIINEKFFIPQTTFDNEKLVWGAWNLSPKQHKEIINIEENKGRTGASMT